MVIKTVYTRDDLVNEALDLLGVTATGQAAEVDDYAKVDGKVDATIASLLAREVVYIADANSILAAYFNSVAAVLAEECKTKFGLSAEDIQKLETDRAQAEMDLRVIARGKPTFQPLATTYF